MKKTMQKWGILCGFALLLFATLFGLAAWVKFAQLGNEISLPLLAIAGVMALLGSLALVAIAFSLMNMSDRTQALGLPNGSVRAVIALSLVVLFAILTVYLFSALNNAGRVHSVACLDEAEQTKFRDAQPDLFISSIRMSDDESKRCFPFTAQLTTANQASRAQSEAKPGEGATSPASGQQSAGGSAPPGPGQAGGGPNGSTPGGLAPQSPETSGASAPAARFKVYFRDLANPVSQDFAKQLLVLIGTLVTSVSSFYFGSKAASDVQDSLQRTDPPTLLSVTPKELQQDGRREIIITGRSLNDVKQAQLTTGTATINDASPVTNATEIRATFNVPKDAALGVWDVVVTDDRGRQARLDRAVTVTVNQPSAPPVRT